MNLGDSIRHGTKWVFIGNTGSQLINFALGLILARLLMPAEFGMVATVQIFTSLAGFVAGGGMGQAIVRSREAGKRDYDLLFTVQFLIGLVIVGFFFAIAPWIGRWYDNPLYTDLLRVSALSFFVRPFFNVPGNMLHREMRFKAKTTVQLSNLVVYNGVALSLAWLGYGPWSLILAGLCSGVAGALQLAWHARWRPGFCFDFSRAGELMRYGLLASSTNIVNYIRGQIPTFILSRTLGPAGVGLYNKGESLARMPHSFITGSVYPTLFRALAAEQDDLDKSRYLFFRSIALVAVYATPFYVGLLWLAEPFVRGVYGPNWVESAGPLSILVLAWPFWLMGNLSGNVLAARNWLDRELAVQITTVIVTVLAIVIGLPYGIDGVAWAIVCTAAFIGLYQYGLVVKCLGAKFAGYPRALVPALVLNSLLAATLFATDHLLPQTLRSNDYSYLALMGLAGGVVYLAGFLYLPFAALHTEQQRWKRKLRLAAEPAT